MTRTLALPAALAALAAFGPAPAFAQNHAHVEKLARQLERQAKVVHDEVDRHFRAYREWKALHRDAEQMVRAADHLHDLAHKRGTRRHMQADLKKLDDLYHHAEGHVKRLKATGAGDREGLRHIRRAMKEMHETLGHLREDLRG